MKTDLYRLLAAVYSSAPLARLAEESPGCAAHALRVAYERREIHETLLRLAAGYRNFADQNRQRHPAMDVPTVNPFHDNCGTLQEGESGTRSLNLREACNKVLHCDSIEHSQDAGMQPFNGPLGTNVVLRGRRQNGPSWTCTIAISAFVECLFFNYDVE